MAEANGDTRNAAVFPTSSAQQAIFLLENILQKKAKLLSDNTISGGS
jgi:hypothetical protein